MSFRKNAKPQSFKHGTAEQTTKQKKAAVDHWGFRYNFAAGSQKSVRAVPNIPDLALRGGLDPAGGQPFRLDAIGDDLVIYAHGTNTATMRAFVAQGFEKDIFAARQICIEHPEARDPSVIEQLYTNSFAFMGRPWMQRNIIDRMKAPDQKQMVREIEQRLESNPTVGRALGPWPKSLNAELVVPKAQQEVSPKPNQHRFTADKRLADPVTYPCMSALEIAAALGISLSAVYEHPGLIRFNTGNRKRLWTTLSVIAVRDSTAL
jgi:hypothetical protein